MTGKGCGRLFFVQRYGNGLTKKRRESILIIVIVLWKLAKPTGGGEPLGISLFLL